MLNLKQEKVPSKHKKHEFMWSLYFHLMCGSSKMVETILVAASFNKKHVTSEIFAYDF